VKKNDQIGTIISKIVIVIFLGLLLISFIYPFYYIFIYSVSIPSEAQGGDFYLLPKGFYLDGYKFILSKIDVWWAFVISSGRAVIGTFVTIICTSIFAYLLTQKKLKFRKAIYRLVVMTMYISAGLIPWYLTMVSYGLRNNFLLYIIPSAIQAFNLILIKTYMEQIPEELDEAARIEGAGALYIFYKIYFPLSKPIIATVAIFSAVGQWNTWMDNFFLADIPELQTLQYLLLKYLVDQTSNLASSGAALDDLIIVKPTPTSLQMTVTMIVTLPILCVYPAFQKYFVKGIMVGAVKG
jgi:putative aldouronate transport system permease protein